MAEFANSIILIPDRIQEWVNSYVTNIQFQDNASKLHNMVHHTLCCIVCDKYIYNMATRDAVYINIEMIERGTQIGILKTYFDNDWNVQYIPDIIRIGVNKDLEYKSYPLMDKPVNFKLITPIPCDSLIFDITLSKNPAAAYNNKIQKHPKVIPIVFTTEDGSLKYGMTYLSEEQIQMCETFLVELLESMSVEERNLFVNKSYISTHRLTISENLLPSLTLTPNNHLTPNLNYKQKFTKIETYLPNIIVTPGTEIVAMRGLLPVVVPLIHVKVSKVEIFDEFIEYIRPAELIHTPRMKRARFINLYELLKGVQEDQMHNDLINLFNIGFRGKSKGLKPPIVPAQSIKVPKTNAPWVEKLISYLKVDCYQTFTLDSLAEYNNLDKLINLVNKTFVEMISFTNAGKYMTLISNTANNLTNVLTIARDKCVWFPIEDTHESEKRIVGFGIRGPSHVKTENARINILYFQLVDSILFNKIWSDPMAHRKYWIWSLSNHQYVIGHLTSTWALKLYAEQNGMSTLVTPINWMSSFIEFEEGMEIDYNEVETSIMLKRPEIVHLFTMQVLFLQFQNPELDGFLADFRKLFMPLARMTAPIDKGFAYFLGGGVELIKKLGGDKANPLVLQIVEEYNRVRGMM